MTRNEDVIEAFLNRKVALCRGLRSDGSTLFSYEVPIAKHKKNEVWVRPTEGLSVSSVRHVASFMRVVTRKNITLSTKE